MDAYIILYGWNMICQFLIHGHWGHRPEKKNHYTSIFPQASDKSKFLERREDQSLYMSLRLFIFFVCLPNSSQEEWEWGEGNLRVFSPTFWDLLFNYNIHKNKCTYVYNSLIFQKRNTPRIQHRNHETEYFQQPTAASLLALTILRRVGF